MTVQLTDSLKKIRERTVFRVTVLISLIIILILSLFISTALGAYKITVGEVLRTIFVEREGLSRQIIWTIRFPRTLVAGLVGVCLSLSGVILQGIMRNPLASPSIIGVSSGAGITGIFILILFPEFIYLVPPVSFIGALSTTLLIYALAWKDGINPMRMVLAGVAVSAFLGAGINALLIFFPDRVQGVVDFMVGSLAAKTWKHFRMLWPYTFLGTALLMLLSKQLNTLLLGDEIAIGLGIHVERVRMIFIAISSLLAASAVSVVGLLGFVGLIVPHMARLLIGSDYRYLIPASALLGAITLIFCDTVARLVLSPMEIPVGIIMAMLGAPFFLYLLRGGLKKNA
ncbi:putative siderophore transport system permease protein YfhA [Oxobacter pfennigii]|uniref:Putative siderophore transport system permease protein YfhA n=1 Tax=Oxobacter pfennigii TaxID=36849 RepID=A0A0P8W5Y0_9CLOT|nr:iron ABC transporter permease [Oxobacter pfennigii]KPU43386.1 putative siderophore transport system permease protein YfhA [Oxobacter pfennigii]